MLKGLPRCIPPKLLLALHEMGHGDTIVIGDANFPAASVAGANHHANIRCDGYGAVEMLDSILQLIPLDEFVAKPVTIMDRAKMHQSLACPVWQAFTDTVAKYDARGGNAVGFLGRTAFYEAAKNAYAVVSTTEAAFYACVILQKGCL